MHYSIHVIQCNPESKDWGREGKTKSARLNGVMETSLHCVWHSSAEWDPSQRVYQPSWATVGSGPSFHWGAAIIYTDTHVHALPTSHLSAHVCVYTVAQVLTEQGHSAPDTRGLNKLPFSIETRIWPGVVTQTLISLCYLVSQNQDKNGAGTYSRASCIMHESGWMISTSAKLFPSIFQFKSCIIQGFIGTREPQDSDVEIQFYISYITGIKCSSQRWWDKTQLSFSPGLMRNTEICVLLMQQLSN